MAGKFTGNLETPEIEAKWDAINLSKLHLYSGASSCKEGNRRRWVGEDSFCSDAAMSARDGSLPGLRRLTTMKKELTGLFQAEQPGQGLPENRHL